jgi:hypothetical protein
VSTPAIEQRELRMVEDVGRRHPKLHFNSLKLREKSRKLQIQMPLLHVELSAERLMSERSVNLLVK